MEQVEFITNFKTCSTYELLVFIIFTENHIHTKLNNVAPSDKMGNIFLKNATDTFDRIASELVSRRILDCESDTVQLQIYDADAVSHAAILHYKENDEWDGFKLTEHSLAERQVGVENSGIYWFSDNADIVQLNTAPKQTLSVTPPKGEEAKHHDLPPLKNHPVVCK